MTGTRQVLVVGLKQAVVDGVRDHLDLPDVQFSLATGLDDVRRAFAAGPIDHVVIGAGIDLDRRLEIVQAVFELSDTTSVHMKDRASGPDAFVPFVRAVASLRFP